MVSSPSPIHIKANPRLQGHDPQSITSKASTSQSVAASTAIEKPDRFQPGATKNALPNAEKMTHATEEQAKVQTIETAARTLADMPTDILERVIDATQSGKRLFDYLNLSALKGTSKAFKELVETNGNHRTLSSTLKKQSTQFNGDILYLPAYLEDLCFRGKALQPEQRQQLIDFAEHLNVDSTDYPDERLNREGWKLRIIETLSGAANSLNSHQIDRLIKLTANFEDPLTKIYASEALFQSGTSLNPKQIDKLIDFTLSENSTHYKHVALKVFATGLDRLSPEQRTQLLDIMACQNLEFTKTETIQIFVKKLNLLSAKQQEKLIEVTISIKNELLKAETLRTFAEKWDVLSPAQRQQLEKANEGRPLDSVKA